MHRRTTTALTSDALAATWARRLLRDPGGFKVTTVESKVPALLRLGALCSRIPDEPLDFDLLRVLQAHELLPHASDAEPKMWPTVWQMVCRHEKLSVAASLLDLCQSPSLIQMALNNFTTAHQMGSLIEDSRLTPACCRLLDRALPELLPLPHSSSVPALPLPSLIILLDLVRHCDYQDAVLDRLGPKGWVALCESLLAQVGPRGTLLGDLPRWVESNRRRVLLSHQESAQPNAAPSRPKL